MALESSGQAARRSLLTIRLFPLMAAVVTWAVLLAWADRALTPAAFRGVPEADVLASWDDDATHLSHVVLNLGPLTTPTVAVFGGSAIREALPAPLEMERLLRRSVGTEVGYLLLAGSGQTLTQSLTLLDAADLPRGSLAILQLAPLRLTFESDESADELVSRRLPLIPDTATARLVRASGGGYIRLPALLSHRAWLSKVALERLRPDVDQCLGRLLRGHWLTRRCPWPALAWPWLASPGAYRVFKYDDRPLPRQTKDSLTRLATFESTLRAASSTAFSVEVLHTFIEHARARGIDVLLVRLPRSSQARETEARFEPQFAAVRAATQARGVHLLDLGDSLGFVDDDFYDLHHLLPPARERFGGIFAGLVAKGWRATAARGPRG